jgi:hypothetical protein
MKRLAYITILTAVVLVLVSPGCAFADAVVSVQPASTTIAPAGTATLDVNISGVTDLFGFQFDVLFGASTLSATSETEGTFLGTGGTTFFVGGTIDNVGGSVANTANTLIGAISGVNGGGTLAVLEFTGLAPGTTTVDLANVTLIDSSFNPISFTTEDASVTVEGAVPTPEPSSLLLLGFGVISLAGLARRKDLSWDQTNSVRRR